VLWEWKAVSDLKAFVHNQAEESTLGHINAARAFFVAVLNHFHRWLFKNKIKSYTF